MTRRLSGSPVRMSTKTGRPAFNIPTAVFTSAMERITISREVGSGDAAPRASAGTEPGYAWTDTSAIRRSVAPQPGTTSLGVSDGARKTSRPGASPLARVVEPADELGRALSSDPRLRSGQFHRMVKSAGACRKLISTRPCSGVPYDLVSHESEAFTDDGRCHESQGCLVVELVEETIAAPEHGRIDSQP